MDGLEAAAAMRMKEEAFGGHIPIVAMTAHAVKGFRELCLHSGMDDYITKPIKPDELTHRGMRMPRMKRDVPVFSYIRASALPFIL